MLHRPVRMLETWPQRGLCSLERCETAYQSESVDLLPVALDSMVASVLDLLRFDFTVFLLAFPFCRFDSCSCCKKNQLKPI